GRPGPDRPLERVAVGAGGPPRGVERLAPGAFQPRAPPLGPWGRAVLPGPARTGTGAVRLAGEFRPGRPAVPDERAVGVQPGAGREPRHLLHGGDGRGAHRAEQRAVRRGSLLGAVRDRLARARGDDAPRAGAIRRGPVLLPVRHPGPGPAHALAV